MTAATKAMAWTPENEAALDRAEDLARRCLRETAQRRQAPVCPAASPFAPFGRPAMALAATLLLALTGLVGLRYIVGSRLPADARNMSEFVTLVGDNNADSDIAGTRLAIERLSGMLADPVMAAMTSEPPPAPSETSPDWDRQDEAFDEEVV